MMSIKDIKYFSSPGWVVWVLHITIALIFFIVGGAYLYIREHDPTEIDKLGQTLAWIVIIFGIIMITYHGHLLTLWKMK